MKDNKYCCICGFEIPAKEDAVYEVKRNGLVHKRCYEELQKKEYLTPKQLAEYLQISYTTLWRIRKNGILDIPMYRLAKGVKAHKLYKRSDVEKYMEEKAKSTDSTEQGNSKAGAYRRI